MSAALQATKLAPYFSQLGKIYNIIETPIREIVKEKEFISLMENYYNKVYTKYYYANTILASNSRIKLEDIFFPLSIVMPSSPTKNFVINQYPMDLLESHKRVLIKDSAGMGKSTLLRRIFLETINYIDEKNVQNFKIPILIDLGKIEFHKNLTDLIYFEVLADKKEDFKENFLKIIESGKFLFLLDGFDEVKRQNYEKTMEELKQFSETYSQNTYIITSREEPMLDSMSSFDGFKIKGLTPDESKQLIAKYCECIQYESDKLIAEIQYEENRSIFDLLKNPLLVTLLIVAYRHKAKIPLRKIDFYEQVFDALFEKHDVNKSYAFKRSKESGLGKFDFSCILRALAIFSLTQFKGKIEYSEMEFQDMILNSKKLTGKDFEVDKMISDLISAVPLFIKDGLSYKWVHKSFLDFYAATWLYQSKHESVEKVKDFVFSNLSTNFNLINFYYEFDEIEVGKKIIKPFLKELVNYVMQSSGVPETQDHKILSFFGTYSITRVPNQIKKLPGSILKFNTSNSGNKRANTYMILTLNTETLSLGGLTETNRVKSLDLLKACKIGVFKDSKPLSVVKDKPLPIEADKSFTLDHTFLASLGCKDLYDDVVKIGLRLVGMNKTHIDISLCVEWLKEFDDKISQQDTIKLDILS